MVKLSEILSDGTNNQFVLLERWIRDRGLEIGGNDQEDYITFMRYIETLEDALEPFKSGEWGAWKAWLVEGAPTRAEGIQAAKMFTTYQCRVDEVLAQHEREEAQ